MSLSNRQGGPIGLLANPTSGKDVRRLVARASVFDNQEKQAIVERAIAGAVAAGNREFRYVDDQHGIVRGAITRLPKTVGTIHAEPVDSTQSATALDTISGARALEDAGCSVVITLGGDGTNRAFTMGWQDCVLMPISTGTNNVFPELVEATLAGTAAGLVATATIDEDQTAPRCKLIDIDVEGERPDLALIDAAVTTDQFVGARALLTPEKLRCLLLTRAEPAAIGMTSIGGMLAHITDADDHGMEILMNQADGKNTAHHRVVVAPIAPGLYQPIQVADFDTVAMHQTITWQGPGVLALDGERERRLLPGQTVKLTLTRSGPKVINVQSALTAASRQGCFVTQGNS